VVFIILGTFKTYSFWLKLVAKYCKLYILKIHSEIKAITISYNVDLDVLYVIGLQEKCVLPM